MKWNIQDNKLEMDEHTRPIATTELLESFEGLESVVNPDTIRRFDSIRTLVAEPQTDSVHFVLELGLREGGDDTWKAFLRLINGSAPLGTRLRRDGPGIAQEVSQASCRRHWDDVLTLALGFGLSCERTITGSIAY